MDLTPIVLAHEQAFTIADVEIRPATREVANAGSVTILEPRVMQLLVALHRADGGVVSKDDLAQLCWEGRIVGEDAINRVVSRLRAVADEDGGKRFRIETITKVGYRLAPAHAEPHPDAAAALPPRAGPRITRRELMIGGGVLAGAAAVTLGPKLIRHDNTPPEARALIKVARDGVLSGSVEQLSNNISKLREAVQLAPKSAEAWGLLAYYTMIYWNFSPVQERSDLRARGLAAIQRALALEPNQADALAAQLYGTPEFRNWYNWERAGRAAFAHHPDHPGLNFALADVLVQVGRARDALPFLGRALNALPLAPPIHTYRITCLWDLGLLDEAEAAVNATFDLMPRYFGIWFTRLYFLMYNGRAAEAVAMVDNVPSRPLGIPDWNYNLTSLQVHALASGDSSKVRQTIDQWKDAPRLGTGFMENAAIFAAFAGDLDEAFRQLDALYFNRGTQYYFAKEQGIYASAERHTYNLFRRPAAAMRRDPRFGALTRELGLDDYWRRSGTKAQVTA